MTVIYLCDRCRSPIKGNDNHLIAQVTHAPASKNFTSVYVFCFDYTTSIFAECSPSCPTP